MTPKQLRTNRKTKRVSQHLLAKRAQVSRYNISLFENGYHKFPNDQMQRIQEALKNV